MLGICDRVRCLTCSSAGAARRGGWRVNREAMHASVPLIRPSPAARRLRVRAQRRLSARAPATRPCAPGCCAGTRLAAAPPQMADSHITSTCRTVLLTAAGRSGKRGRAAVSGGAWAGSGAQSEGQQCKGNGRSQPKHRRRQAGPAAGGRGGEALRAAAPPLTVLCVQPRVLAAPHHRLHHHLRVLPLEVRQHLLHKLPAGTGQVCRPRVRRWRQRRRRRRPAAPRACCLAPCTHRVPLLLPPKSQ